MHNSEFPSLIMVNKSSMTNSWRLKRSASRLGVRIPRRNSEIAISPFRQEGLKDGEGWVPGRKVMSVGDARAQLSPSTAQTFMHEIGHALHSLLSTTASAPRDAQLILRQHLDSMMPWGTPTSSIFETSLQLLTYCML